MSLPHKYVILQNPGHNRVYYKVAGQMALAELRISLDRITDESTTSNIEEIGGVRYVTFQTNKLLSEDDLQIIARLSFVFAVFLVENVNEKEYLLPVNLPLFEYLDSKISSILKYQGKTNELFTRMMVNVAMLASDFSYNDSICLLDPVAGRGTTIYEAVAYGFDAYGVELEPKSVQEAGQFFKKYLETERIKHKAAKRQVAGASKSEAIDMHEFHFANSKEAFKSEASQKQAGFVGGDTKELDLYFPKNHFHLLAGDLPYGIVHGNASGKRTGGATRNPSALLQASLPAWHKVLKKGGVAVVAWNSFLVSRKRMADIFNENGFEAFSTEPFTMFEHMVDKSIKRDIVVARKKG